MLWLKWSEQHIEQNVVHLQFFSSRPLWPRHKFIPWRNWEGPYHCARQKIRICIDLFGSSAAYSTAEPTEQTQGFSRYNPSGKCTQRSGIHLHTTMPARGRVCKIILLVRATKFATNPPVLVYVTVKNHELVSSVEKAANTMATQPARILRR